MKRHDTLSQKRHEPSTSTVRERLQRLRAPLAALIGATVLTGCMTVKSNESDGGSIDLGKIKPPGAVIELDAGQTEEMNDKAMDAVNAMLSEALEDPLWWREFMSQDDPALIFAARATKDGEPGSGIASIDRKVRATKESDNSIMVVSSENASIVNFDTGGLEEPLLEQKVFIFKAEDGILEPSSDGYTDDRLRRIITESMSFVKGSVTEVRDPVERLVEVTPEADGSSTIGSRNGQILRDGELVDPSTPGDAVEPEDILERLFQRP